MTRIILLLTALALSACSYQIALTPVTGNTAPDISDRINDPSNSGAGAS